MDVIIYPNDAGGIDVVSPAPMAPIKAVIKGSVPSGKPHAVIDASTLPDYTFRDAWTADFTQKKVRVVIDDERRAAIEGRARPGSPSRL